MTLSYTHINIVTMENIKTDNNLCIFYKLNIKQTLLKVFCLFKY